MVQECIVTFPHTQNDPHAMVFHMEWGPESLLLLSYQFGSEAERALAIAKIARP